MLQQILEIEEFANEFLTERGVKYIANKEWYEWMAKFMKGESLQTERSTMSVSMHLKNVPEIEYTNEQEEIL